MQRGISMAAQQASGQTVLDEFDDPATDEEHEDGGKNLKRQRYDIGSHQLWHPLRERRGGEILQALVHLGECGGVLHDLRGLCYNAVVSHFSNYFEVQR